MPIEEIDGLQWGSCEMFDFKVGLIAPFGFAAMLSASTAAAEGNWYVGLGLGQSMNKDYECTGCGAAIGSLSDSGFGLKVFGGYRFHENFSVQGGYVSLDDTSATGVGAAWTDTLEVDGLYIAVQGNLPINDRFDVFATAGLFRWQQDVTFNGATGSFDGVDPMFGVGVSYDLVPERVSLQLEWNRFMDVGTNDPTFGHIDDYDLITVNLTYQF